MIAAFAAIIVLVGCASSLGTHRFRVTLEMETPDGVRTASSVREVTYGYHSGVVRSGASELRGEALFLDLGAGRHVVALLAHGEQAYDTDTSAGMLLNILGEPARRNDPAGMESLERSSGRLTGRRTVPLDFVPNIATFADRDDPFSGDIVFAGGKRCIRPIPNSQRCVDEPAAVLDRLAEVFGPGHAFRSMTIEVLDSRPFPFSLVGVGGPPLSRGLENQLPFLRAENRHLFLRRFIGPLVYHPLPQHFVRGQ